MSFAQFLFFFTLILSSTSLIYSKELPLELIQTISPHLKTGTLVHMPSLFHSVQELRNRLVRFLDEGRFEDETTQIDALPFNESMIKSMNKIYSILVNHFGIDGTSKKKMLKPFPLFKIDKSDEKAGK